MNKYFLHFATHAEKNILVFQENKSFGNNGAKNQKYCVFLIVLNLPQAVYPVRSYRNLTIFAPFESSQSQLSGNLHFIKIRCDLDK